MTAKYTGVINKYYQVNPIPVDLNFATPLSANNRYSLNFPGNQASYQVSVQNLITETQGWRLKNITYNTSTISNKSALGTEGATLATLSQVTGSGNFNLNTTGEKGAGSLSYTAEFNSPDGSTITNSSGLNLGFGAVDLTDLSFGPEDGKELQPLELSPVQYAGDLFYTHLFDQFDALYPQVSLYAQSPINGSTGDVVNFSPLVNSVNNAYDYQDAFGQGEYVFKSTNPKVIDYNPDTLCFEFGGASGTANLYIESKDGMLSTLNAPAGQISTLPVRVSSGVEVEELNLNSDTVYLTTKSGGVTSSSLTYSTVPADATGSPAWSCTPDSVATITTNSDGSATVTAVAEGQATVTCRIGEVSATCKVIVSNKEIVCDDIIVEGNGSPDFFNVKLINLQSNPALRLTAPVVRAEMFAFSSVGNGIVFDLNAKRMINIKGTNNWMIGPIPVNGDAQNNWFVFADLIGIQIYASTDKATNGNYVGFSLYSWIQDYPQDATVCYTTSSSGHFNLPSISSGISGTTGRDIPLTGLRISSRVSDVNVRIQLHISDLGWIDRTYDDGSYCGGISPDSGVITNRPIEAFRFSLTGDEAENYELQFRGHVQNMGWQNWQSTSDPNAILGTTGQGLNLEACCFRLVPKGTPLPSADEF